MDCLNIVFCLDQFTAFQFENVYFWTDGGPGHFKTFELVHYFYSLQQKKIFKQVHFNYFIEYHGKSICDSHFSVLSSIIKKYENSVAAITSKKNTHFLENFSSIHLLYLSNFLINILLLLY